MSNLVADLCEAVEAQISLLTDSTTRKIREQMPSYERVPLAEHRRGVREQHRRRISLIAQDRAMNQEDLESAARLAEVRAAQGVPVHEVIGAYHIGDQELWNFLSVAAGEQTSFLPQIASRMMESIHAISKASAAAHAEVTRIRQEHRMTTAQRLIDLLRSGTAGGEAAILARSLGFRADGTFQVLAWARAEGTPEPPDVNRVLHTCSGTYAAGLDPSRTIILTQAANVGSMADAIVETLSGFVGIGIARASLEGAADSILDAGTALSMCARHRPIVWLAVDWLTAILVSNRRHLGPLLGNAPVVAADNEKLVEAVLAMRATSMSMTDAANSIGVHPNTVKYRLGRWHELTGIDARTFDGLALSVIACHLGRPALTA